MAQALNFNVVGFFGFFFFFKAAFLEVFKDPQRVKAKKKRKKINNTFLYNINKTAV